MCRAGVIAALYTVITWALGSFSYGPFQIRPAEAFTILPLFFPETIPALYVGCILANLISLYGMYDVFLGSLATLFAAIFTYFTGKIIKNHILRVAIGGFFPVILNAFIVPPCGYSAQNARCCLLVLVRLYGAHPVGLGICPRHTPVYSRFKAQAEGRFAFHLARTRRRKAR